MMPGSASRWSETRMPAITPGAPHGALETLVLENDRVRLTCVPTLGARIVSMVDRLTGREWLVQGEPPSEAAATAWAADEAVFGGAESYGWDECLPTVAPCADPLDTDPAAPPLRDHGDLWGRPAAVRDEGGVLVATWECRRGPSTFTRRVRLDGAKVVAEYVLENRGVADLPVLWSMHPLFALEPGARFDVEGLASVRVQAAVGVPLAPGHAAWPEAPGFDGRTLALDTVGPLDGGVALKLFGGWELYGSWDSVSGEGLPGVAAIVAPDGAILDVAWYAPICPNLGIWRCEGGWPPPPAAPRVQHALEPTTSPDDDLATAFANGRALTVAPAERVAWSVTFRVRAPGERRA
jgi:hypothetical protein